MLSCLLEGVELAVELGAALADVRLLLVEDGGDEVDDSPPQERHDGVVEGGKRSG